jgi:hypothetical protein
MFGHQGNAKTMMLDVRDGKTHLVKNTIGKLAF